MTVAELRAALAQMPDDARLVVEHQESGLFRDATAIRAVRVRESEPGWYTTGGAVDDAPVFYLDGVWW